MIMRIFQVQTHPGQEEAFARFFHEIAINGRRVAAAERHVIAEEHLWLEAQRQELLLPGSVLARHRRA